MTTATLMFWKERANIAGDIFYVHSAGRLGYRAVGGLQRHAGLQIPWWYLLYHVSSMCLT
jgi:hypothetical protein